MDIQVIHRPAYSLAIAKLDPNERIRAEAGAMVSMSEGVNIETKAEGGFLKSLGRAVLGGESFFQNFFVASANGGEITLAPELPGDIVVIEMKGEKLMVQAGSYMASETGIELNAKVSVKAFMSAEGISMLEATGTGTLLVSSYGAIFEKTLSAGEKYVVDTSHLVAFDGTMGVTPKTVGGLKSTLFSGEGLVIELSGPGKIYIQTRSPQALINWIIPQLPKPPSSPNH
ncbi:MAG: TIGR00266 family protein [Anaerolineales bacterium]|nr:TIGR00266 family protein [Anaerolineales bacterium]MBP6208263.1 TIGR00266 family protein [Anaerolineales bacterium]MBP8164287.1 TIGR00266 family protein [Anaerolineales bacterium]